MIKTGVTLAGVELKNPVMTASGTFGSGAEYSEFVDLNRLGAVVTKGVANVPWPGNPTPRVTETASGMLNAIGLQNPGIDLFCKRDIPFLKQYDTKIVVNVCGKSTEDYCEVVERLGNEPVDLQDNESSCKLTGLGLPSEMVEYTGDDDAHSCPYFYLWDMEGLGKLSAYATMALVKGDITGAVDETFTAGDMGEFTITTADDEGTEIVLGEPLQFTPDNVADYAKLY